VHRTASCHSSRHSRCAPWAQVIALATLLQCSPPNWANVARSPRPELAQRHGDFLLYCWASTAQSWRPLARRCCSRLYHLCMNKSDWMSAARSQPHTHYRREGRHDSEIQASRDSTNSKTSPEKRWGTCRGVLEQDEYVRGGDGVRLPGRARHGSGVPGRVTPCRERTLRGQWTLRCQAGSPSGTGSRRKQR